MKFDKPALSLDDQVALLKRRGLNIGDEAEVKHYLKYIGFYRLSGYTLPLSKKNSHNSHDFKDGVSFADVLNLYRFDRELRLLFIDAVERVEVAFRASFSNFMAIKYGPHWFLNKELFRDKSDCEEFAKRICREIGMDEIGKLKPDKSRQVFIDHYYSKYDSPPLPPCWMVAEILSIASWSKAYACLALREDKKHISTEFGLNPEPLQSWIHAICVTRNICAHHARLWNREFTIKPVVAKGHEKHLQQNGRFYAQAYIVNYLLCKASPESTWWSKLENLLNENTFIDRTAMGFPVAEPQVVAR